MKTPGQIAYETYFTTMFPGTLPPPIDAKATEAWEAAAKAVIDADVDAASALLSGKETTPEPIPSEPDTVAEPSADEPTT